MNLFRILFVYCLLTTTTLQAAEISAQFLAAGRATLSNPHDLKLSADGRHLFVSDVGHNRITILDPDTLKQTGQFGQAEQSGTHDIDIDRKQRAYIADTHNNRVLIYDLDGINAILTGQIDKGILGPEGVLVHPNGNIYVAGAWSNNVVAYNDNNPIAELEGLSSPHDLELAHDGNNIWLADAGNDRLLLLSPQLKILQELSGPAYDFDGVRYLDLMNDGTLIAADKNNHSIKFISNKGGMMLTLGTGKPERGINRFTTPEGVEIKGNIVWLSDSGNDRVVKYRITKE